MGLTFGAKSEGQTPGNGVGRGACERIFPKVLRSRKKRKTYDRMKRSFVKRSVYASRRSTRPCKCVPSIFGAGGGLQIPFVCMNYMRKRIKNLLIFK